jgi:uncharacterized integral membrane protein
MGIVWLVVTYFSITDFPAIVALLGSVLSGLNITLRVVTSKPILNITITKEV